MAELESVAHGRLDDAGAVSILRWHALSGGSLELTQFTGGRVTLAEGTQSVLNAIAAGAEFETRLSTPVAAVSRRDGGLEVHTRAGETVGTRVVVVAVPLNALGGIEFDPPLPEAKRAAIALGQASRGMKIFIHARGEPVNHNAIKPGHPFGYLDTEILYPDGTQLLIGFGPDAEVCNADDLPDGPAPARRDPARLRGARRHEPRLARRRVRARDVGDPPAGVVHEASRRDAEAGGVGRLRGVRLRQRLVGLHGRRDRVRPARGEDRAAAARPMSEVRLVPLDGIPDVEPGVDLARLVGDAIERAGGLEAGDVVVVAQKVVSKAEGRIEETSDHVEVILREARAVRRRRGDLVIAETEHGFVCASAGVDRSNAPGENVVVLLRADPDGSAARIRAALEGRFGSRRP